MANTQGKWKGYYKIIQAEPQATTLSDSENLGIGGTLGNYSWYSQLVQGNGSRVAKYREYDLIDNNDPEIAFSLDTLAEEITGNNSKNDDPIEIDYLDDGLDVEVTKLISVALNRWVEIHDWTNRLFHVARHTVKYGDAFFKKNDLLTRWDFLYPHNILGAITEVENIRNVLGWQIKNDTFAAGSSPTGALASNNDKDSENVPNGNVVRFTLNDDMSENAPFGESVLKSIYRTQKQKELLEDSIIIYRIQRAPERRVFYIDVGKMQPNRVKQYLEQIKNEIKQKKIPSRNGGKSEIDSIYNPQCIALDTKIPLLDGRELELNELIQEYNNGKENWAYSINPKTGESAPGLISWAGITKKNAKTIKITLDNENSFVCTPDHKIPVQGKGYIEARYLTNGDSLFPFNTRSEQITNNKKSLYTQVYDTSKKEWIFVHRMVGNFIRSKNLHKEMIFDESFKNEKRFTIHHNDFNPDNNNPDNLIFMGSKDHFSYHSKLAYSDKFKEGYKNWYRNLCENKELKKEYYAEQGKKKSKLLKENPEIRAKFIKNLKSATPETENQEVVFTKEMFSIVYNTIKENSNISLINFMKSINSNKKFLNIYKEANKEKNKEKGKCQLYKIDTSKITQIVLKKKLKEYGYNDFKTLRTKIRQSKLSEIQNDERTTYDFSKIELANIIIRGVKAKNETIGGMMEYFGENNNELERFKELYPNIKDQRSYKKEIPDNREFDTIAKANGYSGYNNMIKELSNFNHKIVSIEECHNQDVGTLTIDQDELYHDYHNFALSGLIYVKNSMSEDYFLAQRSDGRGNKVETLPGGCLALDTKIPLLDGRELELNELIQEYNNGKENWAYSCNPITGEFHPGLISWAGITNKNSEVYELELDNGEKIIGTADHKFPVWGNGKTELKDLKVNDSIISFNMDAIPIKGESGNTYSRVLNHKTKKYEFVHRTIANYFEKNINEKKVCIHHNNYNRYDNSPNNLIFMGNQDHWNYHAYLSEYFRKCGTEAWIKKYNTNEEFKNNVLLHMAKMTKIHLDKLKNDKEYYENFCLNVSNGVKSYINNLTEADRLDRDKISINNWKIGSDNYTQKRKDNPEWAKERDIKSGISMSNRLKSDPKMYEEYKQRWINAGTIWQNQKIEYSNDLITIIRYLFEDGYNTTKKLVEKLNSTSEFIDLWVLLNSPKDGYICKISLNFTENNLYGVLNHFGYNTWSDFKYERYENLEFDKTKISKDRYTTDEINFIKFLINDVLAISLKMYNIFKNTIPSNINVKFSKFCKDCNIKIKRKFPTEMTYSGLQTVCKSFGFDSFKHFVEYAPNFNHKIVSIKKLEITVPVGTLTIDQDEKHHNFHTFALSSGIYTFNSGLGQLDDLDYFADKVTRGLKIPSSYMKRGQDNAVFSDGKAGVAFIEELRFAKYIERLQGRIESVLDYEFKLYLKTLNLNIDYDIFKLKLPEASNFANYRQAAMDVELLNMYGSADGIPYLSKRYIMKRYLQLTDADIIENEEMKAEESGLNYKEKDTNDTFLSILYNPDALGTDELGGDLGGDLGDDITPDDLGGDTDTGEDII